MISVSGKKWAETRVNKNSLEKIKQDFKFSDIVSKLLISRNFDQNEIYEIQNISQIVNPFKNNKDFIKASNILENSIKFKHKVCIFGDYDVDGISSTTLFARFFDHIKHPYFFYIPHREKDGYGPSISLFKKINLKKTKLVIMVDCGSSSNEAIEYLKSKKIKSIIIDHHEINKPYPKPDSLINPKKNIDFFLKDYFCATTLSYFFLENLTKRLKSSFKISDFLIYVLLALVCDVMPLRKINRSIAINVIKNFDIKNNLAFKTLYDLSGKKNKLSIDDLGYFIGPIINSSGRLLNSNIAADLLISNSASIVKSKSEELIKLNNKRKKLEGLILSDIDFNKITKKNNNIIFYYNSKIHEGLIGIIASRLKDFFNKPSIVITNSKSILKASARSTKDYNIGHLIEKLKVNGLIEKGGGHNMAAGFSIKKNKINDIEKFIYKDFELSHNNSLNKNYYDSEISVSGINYNFVNEINRLRPFGNANQLPIFLIKNLKIIKSTIINERHINAILKPKTGQSINSICFNSFNTPLGDFLISYKKEVNVIVQIQENIWNNKKTLQLNIKDILTDLN
jgi:single-stranded-DNA-specific exonuclease